MHTGFWLNLGAPGTVDWCEANYAHTEYIAEWWSDITDSATSRSQARYIYVAHGANVTGIDLALQPANP